MRPILNFTSCWVIFIRMAAGELLSVFLVVVSYHSNRKVVGWHQRGRHRSLQQSDQRLVGGPHRSNGHYLSLGSASATAGRRRRLAESRHRSALRRLRQLVFRTLRRPGMNERRERSAARLAIASYLSRCSFIAVQWLTDCLKWKLWCEWLTTWREGDMMPVRCPIRDLDIFIHFTIVTQHSTITATTPRIKYR